jgi:hypothetical protein
VTPLLPALLAAVLAAPAAPSRETGAERLHRKGVHCMEEIERRDCAIEHFEALLDERTDQRELVTDALLRLVKLYEKEDRPDDLKAALRRFWDAGKTDVRRGHLPYTARFFPKDFDLVFHAHIERLLAAPLAKHFDEVAEFMFTCDPDRRAELEELRLFRKSERRAREKGITVQKAMSEVSAEEKKDDERRKQRAAERREQQAKDGKPRKSREPIFSDALCATARALGDDRTSDWTRGAFAMSHADFSRSAAVLTIPDLDAKLAAGEQAGRLVPAGKNVWALDGRTYDGGAVHVARLDAGELVLAPAALMPELAANHARGRRTLNREIDRLIVGVPIDAGFFAVATRAAVSELGFGGGSKGRRTLLQWLLPRPEGLQMAGVAHEYFGLFLRMPTDNPVKASALVGLARKLIENQADADPEAADFLRLLDVTQATDKKALLLSYVLSRRQLETLVLR